MRSSLAKHTAAYGLTNAISTAIPTAVGPILTHYLSPTDYGIASVFMAAFNFLGPLGSLGVQAAFRRRYYEQDKFHYPSYIYSATLWSLIQLAAITVGAMLTYRWWGTSQVSMIWALSLLPWVGGRYVWQAASAQLQLQKKPLGYGLLSWSSNLLNVAVSLTLVIGFGLGWEGRVLGQVVASVAIGIASVAVLRRLVGGGATFNREYVKDAISFGAPTVPYAMLDRAMRFGDRTLIAAIVSLEQAGFYALGAQVGNLLTQVSTSLNQAWQPWLYEELGKATPRAARKVVLSLYVLAALLMGGAVALWLAVRWLFPLLIGEKYQDAVQFVPWLCVGFGLRGVASLFAQLIVYSKQTRELTRVAVVVGITNLTLEVLMIWRFGAIGAAQATCIAYGLNVLMLWRTARRLVPLPGY